MSTSPCIPEFLCGRTSVVRRNCRRIIKAAISAGSFLPVVSTESFIPIDDAPGQIIIDKVAPSIADEHVLLWTFGEVFHELTISADRGDWYELSRQLHWNSLDEFWMCLIVLGEGHYLLPIKSQYDKQRFEDCRYVLKKLLHWWPEFCRLDERFYNGVLQPQTWFGWGRATWGFLRAIGQEHVIFETQHMDAEHAGERINQAVIESERSHRRGL